MIQQQAIPAGLQIPSVIKEHDSIDLGKLRPSQGFVPDAEVLRWRRVHRLVRMPIVESKVTLGGRDRLAIDTSEA